MKFIQQPKILFISTFTPVKCGIANFTQDLVNAIAPEFKKNIEIAVCALDNNAANIYQTPVRMVMNGYDMDSCVERAAAINNDSSIKLICIEHEFGLYGGEMGSFLLFFLGLIEKPFVVRFHTVLPAPVAQRLKIVQQICQMAKKVVVMTRHSARLLHQDYQIPPEKIVIIRHGTHDNSQVSVQELKSKYELKDKYVLCTFGLLSPNKGIEKGILAMNAIRDRFPDAMYIVLGQTHPNLIAQEGERYRDYLQQLIEENNLQKHVRLVNEYAPVEKLMEYLALTDIYLFTSKDPDQAVSGTFLYAMSAGCAIISNSFVLAKEMLDADTGVILETTSESELAQNAIQLLENEALRKQMGHNAFLKTRDATWPKVSVKHSKLFRDILGLEIFKPMSVQERLK